LIIIEKTADWSVVKPDGISLREEYGLT